jgi:energy-coupling factor transporter ATP-binding protein EcfA2
MIQWYDVYKELAKLLYEKGGIMSIEIDEGNFLYFNCKEDKNFKSLNPWFRKFLNSPDRTPIDPLHIFASISEKHINNEIRVKRINAWFSIFEQNSEYNEIDFASCSFSEDTLLLLPRNIYDAHEIWGIFLDVIDLGQEVLLSDRVKKALSKNTISFRALTIFLYWLDSELFLPLEKNIIKILMSGGSVTKQFLRSTETYFRLLKTSGKTTIYREYVKRVKEFYLDNSHMGNVFDVLSLVGFINNLNRREKPQEADFKIVAIRILNETQDSYSKVLEKEFYYTFSEAYAFESPDKIIYIPEKDISIYSTEKLEVNISAIVGKNGSGKSTLSEIMFMVLNNLSYKYLGTKHDLQFINGLFVELYIKISTTIFRIDQLGNQIKIIEYIRDGNYFTSKQPISSKQKIRLDDFFYTLAVNYSHYGLNSSNVGEWITKIYEKNDGYQVPITINPFRQDGSLNINKESELVLSRLVTNLLEPVSESHDLNLRKITDNKRSAAKLKFVLHNEKVEELGRLARKRGAKREFESVLEALKDMYNLNTDAPFFNTAVRYIHQKLIKISNTYRDYKRFRIKGTTKLKTDAIRLFFRKINSDTSHVTFKIRQTINYLINDKLQSIELNKFVDINTFSDNIEYVKRNSKQTRRINTVELIPPPFFKAEIELTDGTNFNDLSSGEKQKIYTVSSLTYHLLNINSVKPSRSVFSYNYVNIVFDEVELYFHPDMQRTFISYLLDYLNLPDFENIYGLQFCFITHSPFILSDIPTYNIIFLEKDLEKKEEIKRLKTFGANIHELLMNGFFMKQTIGEIAGRKIQEILEFHKDISTNLTEINKTEYKNKYKLLKERYYFIRENLGEVYIKNIVRNHIEEIEELLDEKSFLDKQIANLEFELSNLKEIRNVKSKLS